jgi:hypothetical protein
MRGTETRRRKKRRKEGRMGKNKTEVMRKVDRNCVVRVCGNSYASNRLWEYRWEKVKVMYEGENPLIVKIHSYDGKFICDAVRQ